MAATTGAAALSMKLLVDTKSQRVLFAEASKEVVDFLFSLLALPVATAVKLLGTDAMVGSVGNLYSSVDKLDATYVQPGAAKDALLCPTALSLAGGDNSSLLRLPEPSSVKTTMSSFKCSSCQLNYVADPSSGTSTNCPDTSYDGLKTGVEYVAPKSGKQAQNSSGGGAKGFVQGIVTYMVLDNLTVTPTSAISSVTLLSTFAVRDFADLQEKTVQLGYNEGLAILKASLQSKTVLTDVFLAGNKNSPARGFA